MNDWLPVVAGAVTIAVAGGAVAIARHLWPDHWIVAALLKPIGLRITGPYDIPSRADQLRRAGYVLASAPVLFGASLLAFEISLKFPGLSNARMVAEVYFFTLLLLSGVMLLMGLTTGLGALLIKPTTIVGDVEVIAHDLACFLETVAVAGIPGGVWPDFATVRYQDPRLEAIREALATQFPRTRPPQLPGDHAALVALAGSARALSHSPSLTQAET